MKKGIKELSEIASNLNEILEEIKRINGDCEIKLDLKDRTVYLIFPYENKFMEISGWTICESTKEYFKYYKEF